MAGAERVGHVGLHIISKGTVPRETSAGRGTDRERKSLPARRPSTSDTHTLHSTQRTLT